jgi:predicted extracellular nuclease
MNLSHNTAWIYSAPVAVALAPQRPATEEPPVVAIMKIQGSGETSPWKGRLVRTTGVVTQVAAKRAGFWIQDPAGDGDPKTSDGLYVSAAGLSADAVFPEVKDSVRVTGEVDEESKKNELPRTRLRDVSRIEVLAKGNPLPEPVVLSHLPNAADAASPEGLAAWEALEGMRVRVEDAAAKLVGVVDYASGSYRVEPEVSQVVDREAPAGAPPGHP